MSKTTNSFSSVLAQFTRLQISALEILQGLSKAVSSSADTVVITFKTADGKEVTYNVPSLGYIEDRVNRLDSTIEKLMGIDGSDANIRMPDGSYKKIFTARLLKSPKKITGLAAPQKFAFKNNWFFESFLSPALYVPFDVTQYVELNATKILVKRIILNTPTEREQNYFNTFFKNRNDIRYEELIASLQINDIQFFVDEDVQDLPLSVLRYEGNFDIIRYEDIEQQNPDGTLTKRRKYFLNKLTYTDNLVFAKDSIDLKVNDRLSVGESIYRVDTIDRDINAVTLKKISGFDTITIGADILRIYSESFSLKTANVGIGFNERQIVFFKAVDPDFNIVSTVWSDGVAFYSNELTVETSRGVQTLENFYQTQVTDFGLQFLSNATEKTIPAVYGEIPNSPVLQSEDFKVVRINQHKFDDKDVNDVKKKAADKVRLNSEIVELDKSIEKKKNELTTKKFATDAERRGVKNELDGLIREKTAKSNLYASLVQELAVLSEDKPASLDSPKYRIRGFFEIPEPVDSPKTGLQFPIQFEIEYRYLRLDGSATGVEQFEFTDANGITLRGSYSNWESVKTDIRKRIYDDAAGSYIWKPENLENPDEININQIDIPITKGEKVEIRIRSISEAGWPINPFYSEFSNSIIIEFPEEFVTEDEATNAINQAVEESTRVKFQLELDARGLDLHLSRAFTTGEKYYAHDSEQISSGFFTSEGNVINLFEKLKAMETEIADLRAKVEQIKGNLIVTLVEPNGQKNIIKNGDVLNLFAGYYEDIVLDLPPGERKGAIITTVYRLVLENSENSPLELISRLPGGIGERLPNTIDTAGQFANRFGSGYGWVNEAIQPTDRDYNSARRYDIVPIVNNSVDASETNTASKISSNFHQSQQLLSQYVFSRYTDIGLSPKAVLYKDAYDSNGIEINRTDINYDPTLRSLFPTSPTPGNDSFVWSGTYDTSNNPEGNGTLSSFCIHIEHPALNDGNIKTFAELQNPTITLNGYIEDPIFGYIPTTNSDEARSEFKMSRYAGLTINKIYFGNSTTKKVSASDARAQLNYRDNWNELGMNGWTNILPGGVTADNIPNYPIDITFNDYDSSNPLQYILPDKFGFNDRDRYLIGNHTCGSYLYVAPSTIDQLLVDGTDARGVKFINKGENAGIEIPILFQFRMTDYFGQGNQGIGIIGGFDPLSSVQLGTKSNVINLSYSKKIGLDIYVKNETTFSFDLIVQAKYRRESLSQKLDVIGNKVSIARDQVSIKKSQIKELR
jgi:hypothetical protein